MADINNIKIGNTTPDAVMFDSLSGVYNLDLNSGTWEVNTGWEVEFIGSRYIKINKFKIDTWGIRRLIINGTEDFTKAKRYEVYVTGLTEVNKLVNFTKAYCGTSGYDPDWKAGDYTSGKYIQGLGIQAGKISNTTAHGGLQMAMHPWDIGTVTNIKDGYIIGSDFDGSYYAWTIGLFGGVQDPTSADYEKEWDISDTPIIIDLGVNHVNPASKECWKIISNTTNIYYKAKTLDNCWRKYGLASDFTAVNGVTVTKIAKPDLGNTNSIYLPPIEDLLENKNLAWNISIYNTEYWDTIKNWYANNTIPGTLLPGKLFSGNNMSGAITLNIEGVGAFHGEDLFSGSNISEVNFTFSESGYIGSCNKLFRNAKQLTKVTTNKKFTANDLSGMFEFDSALVVCPKGIIGWNQFGENDYTNIGYCWEYCSKLTTIEAETENRDTAENTIVFSRFAPQVFLSCSKLAYIGPILDLKRVVPSNTDNTYAMFSGCTSLTNARIKNLNHGDWRLDGTGNLGTLASLDNDSVVYLFNNLTDLVSEYKVLIFPNDLTSSIVNSANLYCPSEWEDYITDTMVSEANAKGWRIYIGGTLKEVTNKVTITWIPVNDNGDVDVSVEDGTLGDIVFFKTMPLPSTIVEQLNTNSTGTWPITSIPFNVPTEYSSITTTDGAVEVGTTTQSVAYVYWDKSLTTFTENDIYTGWIRFTSGDSIEVEINSIVAK